MVQVTVAPVQKAAVMLVEVATVAVGMAEEGRVEVPLEAALPETEMWAQGWQVVEGAVVAAGVACPQAGLVRVEATLATERGQTVKAWLAMVRRVWAAAEMVEAASVAEVMVEEALVSGAVESTALVEAARVAFVVAAAALVARLLVSWVLAAGDMAQAVVAMGLAAAG